MKKLLFTLFLLLAAAPIYSPARTFSPSLRPTNTTALDSPGQSSVKEAARDKEGQEDDVERIDTSLVTIPVSVFDRNGKFVPNLRREDFRVFEDGIEQQLAYFEPIEKPFTVLLMLDTSESTIFSLEDIQNAAIAFVNQLRPDDRVIVISFSNVLSIMNKPTSDRAILREAIRRTRTKGGTSLYPAVDYVINRILKPLRGRKALILFTDGADSGAPNSVIRNPRATFNSTLQDTEEADVLIYPVQYNTLNLMLQKYDKKFHAEINRQFRDADAYLRELAKRSGGRLFKADALRNVGEAFAQIAEELRRQYSLGYYPKENAPKGARRQLRVRVNRTGLVVSARTSYIRD
ncbi:MAG TPA: VWA domain-containing protein [Pyrinomonadaceae bacterium]|jgi:VWFA-related protein|nr:VWA domain-containing protein [Pyrinomonadaceae bacterium]